TFLAVAVAIASIPVWAIVATILRPRSDPAALTGRRLAGTVAMVTVAIPKGGVGRIAFGASGRRSSRAARCSDGESIERGTKVVIVDTCARVTHVRSLPADLEEVFR